MKKLLVLNFFPAFVPPSSGGELRYFKMYSMLSSYFDVTLLSPTFAGHPFEIVTHSDTFREYRIPKDESIHHGLHHRLDKEGVCTEVSALVCALSSAYPNEYHKHYFDLCEKADIIVHESPYMVQYDMLWGFDNKPRIYNSYNVEYLLMKQLYRGDKAENYLQYISSLEKKLTRESALVFATSEEELDSFIDLYGLTADKIVLAPNGIDTEEVTRFTGQGKKTALFIGSQHPPNVEAVDFIIRGVAPKCPEIDFLIAGTCCTPFLQNPRGENVQLLGRVDDEKKKDLFTRADVAINPMFSGAGTNLKTLEFLAAEMPLISTDVGVRGLGLRDNEHFARAAKDNFALRLSAIVANEQLCERIARAGRLHIIEHFSWEGIAAGVRVALDKLPLAGDRARKRILLLNDFSAARPTSGGEMRINRLYSELSRYHDIALLCLNGSSLIEQSYITSAFTEISFPKTPEHVVEETRVNSTCWISASDIINSYMCAGNRHFICAVGAFYKMADLVVLVHPYMLPALDQLRGKPLIYESLNFESGLKRDLLKEHPSFETLIARVERVEKAACRDSTLLLGVTREDLSRLTSFAGTTPEYAHVIANGVDVKGDAFFSETREEVKKALRGRRSILFVGSGHGPNVAALAFIIRSLAPALPHRIFLIIGTVCNAFKREEVPENVLLFGRLDEAYKEVLLRISDAAINPITEGSGSNLKLAEYLAYRLPTVTTKIGARGYDVADGREAIICDLPEFAARIESLFGDDAAMHTLSERGNAYARRELGWNTLANDYFAILDSTVFKTRKKKLLVLTYRFTVPPLGGAEVYLLNILREMDRLGDLSITIATLDIHDIINRYHFSTDYTYDDSVPPLPGMGSTVVYKFRCDDIREDSRLLSAGRLFERWMEEFVVSSLRHLDKYAFPLLMGGWHFPECSDRHCEIWSSSKALVYAEGTDEMVFIGYSPQKGVLAVSSQRGTLHKTATHGDFRISVKTSGARWVQLDIDPFAAADDPRPLGVRICGIRYHKDSAWHDLNLNYNYRDYLKEYHLGEYIDELIRIAEARPPEFDALFQFTRGPISSELENWLDRNLERFDIVMGHSVPFSTSVLAAKYANKFAKPLVILPHFHMDDEFYHWKSYYDALQSATAVLASPKRSIDLFYRKIGVVAHYIHGGAVYKEEHAGIDTSDFFEVYTESLPFFLVLGRKAGAKNYRWAIDAVKKINEHQKVCQLVIIGRDEDGVGISASDARYLGEQHRNVVLGALKECAALINMSESESFGIVILEAWMQKKPVIVNEQCGAFAELVEDGVNGFLANRDNLVDRVRSILERPSQAGEMGAQGFQKVSEEFTWQAIAKNANQLLLNETGKTAAIRTDDQISAPSCDIEEEISNIRNLHSGGVPHEPDFLFFKNLPEEDGLLLDVGANAGQSAVSFRFVDKNRRILSLEPNYLFRPVLQFVKEKLVPRFDYMLCGLGDQKATLRLTVPYVDEKPYYQECSIDKTQFDKPWVKERLASYGTRVTFKEMDIQIVAADDLELRPDVVKIDAEGFELSVLQGMKNTITSSYPVFLIENNDYVHVTDFLKSLGYEVFVYDANSNRLHPPGNSANCFYLHRTYHNGLLKALAY